MRRAKSSDDPWERSRNEIGRAKFRWKRHKIQSASCFSSVMRSRTRGTPGTCVKSRPAMTWILPSRVQSRCMLCNVDSAIVVTCLRRVRARWPSARTCIALDDLHLRAEEFIHHHRLHGRGGPAPACRSIVSFALRSSIVFAPLVCQAARTRRNRSCARRRKISPDRTSLPSARRRASRKSWAWRRRSRCRPAARHWRHS